MVGETPYQYQSDLAVSRIVIPDGGLDCLSRYDECAAEPPGQGASRPWLEGMFEGAQAAIQQASKRLTAFIAAKVSPAPIAASKAFPQPTFGMSP